MCPIWLAVCQPNFDGWRKYSIKSPVTYSYSIESYAAYSRFPKCPTGFAVVDYSTPCNSGAGWLSEVEVDDPSQPAYQAAFTVKGLSGVLPLHCFEGIVFNGNSNTVAIKLIGCCGVKPHAVFFVITVMVLYLIMVPPREPGGCVTLLAYENLGQVME